MTDTLAKVAGIAGQWLAAGRSEGRDIARRGESALDTVLDQIRSIRADEVMKEVRGYGQRATDYSRNNPETVAAVVGGVLAVGALALWLRQKSSDRQARRQAAAKKAKSKSTVKKTSRKTAAAS